MSRHLFRSLCFLALAFVCLAPQRARAQNSERERDSYNPSTSNVDIIGQVRLSGSATPAPGGVRILLEKVGGGTLDQMTTDSRGRFRFAQLPRGQYVVNITASCYQPERRQVELLVIFRSYLDVELMPDNVSPNCAAPHAGPASLVDARTRRGTQGVRARERLARKGQKVLFGGVPVLQIDARERARRFAYVPQTVLNVFPFTALEVVLRGRSPYTTRFRFESNRDVEVARAALSAVDASHLEARPVTELSGGERQLVALAQEPECLLLAVDEETAQSLGVNVRRSERLVYVASSLIVGVTVAVGGTIGFVSLIVPHAVRLLFGEDVRIVMPCSFVLGAAFLMLAPVVPWRAPSLARVNYPSERSRRSRAAPSSCGS
jgi:hypothetical protein